MQNITIECAEVNIDGLSMALRGGLGIATSGFSTLPGKVIVHLVDNATPQQMALAEQIVQAHDPAQLTPKQQQQASREQLLAQYRQENATALNPDGFAGEAPAIQQLAKRIAWLEQEIRALREE